MTTNAYAGDPGGLDLHFATTDKTGRKAFVPAAVMTDEAGQSVSSTNPLPIQPSFVVQSLLAGTVFDGNSYGMVEFDFRNFNGNTVTIYRDPTDATTVLTGFYDQNGGGPYSSITAAGVYQIPLSLARHWRRDRSVFRFFRQ